MKRFASHRKAPRACIAALALALLLVPVSLAVDAPGGIAIVSYGFPTQATTLFLPLGGDTGQLEVSPRADAYNGQWAIELSADIVWQLDGLDPTQPGWQTLFGDVALPEGYYNAGQLPLAQKVYVYTPDEDGPWSTGGQVLDTVFFDTIDKALILPQGGDISCLELPQKGFGYSYSTWLMVDVELEWDIDAFDSTVAGRQAMAGRAVLPEGYYYFGPQPQQQIIVYDDHAGGELIINAQVTSCRTYPCGDDEDALNAFKATYSISATGHEALEAVFTRVNVNSARYSLEGGYQMDIPVTWDLSLVDMSTPGVYYPFSGLPDYFQLNDIARQGTAIVVQDPNEVDLNGWCMYDYGYIYFDWFKGVENPQLWVSIDNGQWQHADTLADEDFWTYEWQACNFMEDYRDGLYRRLSIAGDAFPAGHTYEFAVRYENDGLSANSMVLDFTDGKRFYSGDIGGPRDGDDRGEITLPRPDDGDDDNDYVVPPVPDAPQGEEELPGAEGPQAAQKPSLPARPSLPLLLFGYEKPAPLPAGTEPAPDIQPPEEPLTLEPEDALAALSAGPPAAGNSTKAPATGSGAGTNGGAAPSSAGGGQATAVPPPATTEAAAQAEPQSTEASGTAATYVLAATPAYDSTQKSPAAQRASVAIISLASALLALLLWKWLGKRLVKR